jgi:aminoglycoside phosphotransferase (APT) family kinase protein
MAIVDDPEVDLGALAGHFGHWLRRQPGHSRSAVSNLRQASQANGFSNETYRVTVTRPDRADAELILRLPPARTGLFPGYDIPRQYAFMQRLQREPGLRLAPCRWLERDPSVLGRPFFVTDFVAGDVAGDQPNYLREGFIVEAGADQRRRLWDTSFEQLEHLARVRWEGAALDSVDWPHRGTPRFLQHVQMWTELGAWGRRQLPDDGADPLLAELERWLTEHRPHDEVPGIVWGDARFGNIICRDFEPVALLDWELAVVGDPITDLAYMLFHVFLTQIVHGDADTPRRMAGFRGDAETVARWCDALQRSADPYRAYWLFNAYKMLCIWQCKAALMVRAGTWSVEQGLEARRGLALRPFIGAVMEGGPEAAFLR